MPVDLAQPDEFYILHSAIAVKFDIDRCVCRESPIVSVNEDSPVL